MWNVRVSIINGKEKQLYDSVLYNSFRRALSDTLEGTLDSFCCVPIEEYHVQFACPTHMIFRSTDKENKPDDLEIKYQLGDEKYLLVYIGSTFVIDNE